AFFLLRGIRAVGPVLLVFMIFAMGGAAAGLVAVSTMAGMKVVVAILVPLGLLSVAAAAMRRPRARLLLLRVFGFKRRTERLFDLLSARLRHAGPIALIAAPDLAS